MSENFLGKYITIDNLSNSKAEIIPVGNTEQDIIEEVKGNTVIGTDISVTDVNSEKAKIKLIGNIEQNVIEEVKGTTVTGTNIVVNDVESTAAKIKLIGDIQQEVREGYNLIDCSNPLGKSGSVSSWSFKNNILNVVSTNGTYGFIHYDITKSYKNNAGKQIRLKLKELIKNENAESDVQLNITNNDGTSSYIELVTRASKEIIRTISSDTSNIKSVMLAFYSYNDGTSLGDKIATAKFVEPMLLIGDVTDKPYEAYGKAPTLNFPSEVKTVTGDVKLNISNENIFVPELKVDGTNISKKDANVTLIDDEYTLVATGADMYFGEVKEKNTYYLAWSGRLYNVKGKSKIYFLLTNELLKNNYITTYDKNKKSLGFVQMWGNKGSYTIPENVEYISFRFGKSGATAGETYKTKVMLSFEEITEYKKHQGEIKPLTLGDIELFKDSYFYKAGSKWYVRNKYFKEILTKITRVAIVDASVGTNKRRFQHILSASSLASDSSVNLNPSFMNRYELTAAGRTYSGDIGFSIGIDTYNNSVLNIYDEKYNDITEYGSEEALKQAYETYLAENETYIVYPLETPTDTEITDETLIAQLNAIKEASAYEGTTVIMSTGDVLPINVEFTYNHVTPSPSAEIPSEVKTVTGNVEVKVRNKNLFDIDLWENVTLSGVGATGNGGTVTVTDKSITIENKNGGDIYTNSGMVVTGATINVGLRKYLMEVEPNTTYVLSFDVDGTPISGAHSNSCMYSLIDENYVCISYASLGGIKIPSSKHTKVITTTATTKYIGIRFGTMQEVGQTRIYSNIQLEKNSVATEYVPHQGQVFPLTLGDIEIFKDSYFYKAGSKWFLKNKYARYVFVGKEIGKKSAVNLNNSFIFTAGTDGIETSNDFINFIKSLKYSNSSTSGSIIDNIYSNHFKAKSPASVVTTSTEGIALDLLSTGTYEIRIGVGLESELNTISSFNSWATENKLEIIGELAKPTDTEITDETLIAQLNAIKEASAYEGTTVIMSTGDVLPINVEFTYNHVVPSPSLEIPSEVKSVGDNINLCDGLLELGSINTDTGENIYNNEFVRTVNYIDVAELKSLSVQYKNDKATTKQIVVYHYDTNKNFIKYTSANSTKYNKDLDEDTKYIKLRLWGSVGGSIADIEELKVENGLLNTAYSLPNLGSINQTVSNKNFFDKEKILKQTQVSTSEIENGVRITCNSNTTYNYVKYLLIDVKNLVGSKITVSGKIKNSALNKGRILSGQCDVYGNYYKSSFFDEDGSQEHIIFDSKQFHYFSITLYGNSDGTAVIGDYVDYTEIQVEIGDKSEYVEHKKQEYIIPTQKPFRAIGDYGDTFIKIEGKWYESHICGEYVVTGEEPWTLDNAADKPNTSLYSLNVVMDEKIKPATDNEQHIKCNMFKTLASYSKDEESIYSNASKYFKIRLKKERLDSVSSTLFRNYLKELYDLGTPVKIVYLRETPELIPCTPQQENILKQLQNIHMYSGTNNFYGESFVEPQINLTIKKSVEDYDMYITADGYLHIPELNKRYLVDLYESNIPIMPEAVESSVRVAGRDGDIGLNTTYEPVPFNIVCYTEDDLSLLEKVNEEKAMNKFLNKIKNKKIKLAFEKYDSYYEVKYNLALVTSNYPKHLKFSIPLKSSDSYGKELIKKIIIGSASKESDTIENVGAIFTIYGPAISPIISLNDYSMEFSTDILEGSRIEIDSNKSTITHINSDGVKTNVMKYYNHQFPKIENGNNELKVLSGIEDGGNVMVEWNDLKL